MPATDRHTAIEALETLLAGARVTQTLSVAASLGIADLLADGPRDVRELAAATGTHEDTLYRLLATLAAAAVLHEDDGRRFRLTEVGELLRSDAPGSRRDWAILLGRPYLRDAWSNLEHSIRTGENAFAAVHGEGVWTWRGRHPEEEALFNRAMAGISAGVGEAVAEAFDFGSLGGIVDVGGGTGSLLAAILRRHPSLRGVLFDQRPVVSSPDVADRFSRLGVGDRVELVGGSFFEGVPAGAGGYVMKSILHDWEDEPSLRILRAIRMAVGPDSRLIVVEVVLGPPNEDLAGRLLDLHMLVMPGGRERSEPEWRSLFERGGFELIEVRPTASRYSLLIGAPSATAALSA